MKLKRINKYITEPVEEFYPYFSFLTTVLSETEGGFIAGGCFKDIFNSKKPKDIDVYFEHEDDFIRSVKIFEKSENYKNMYRNPRAAGFEHIKSGNKVDLIEIIFGTPEEILNMFDFTITKFAYKEDFIDSQVIYHQDFFKHLQLKKMVLENAKLDYPYSTFERVLRYQEYGYTIDIESKINLIKAIKDCDNQISFSRNGMFLLWICIEVIKLEIMSKEQFVTQFLRDQKKRKQQVKKCKTDLACFQCDARRRAKNNRHNGKQLRTRDGVQISS